MRPERVRHASTHIGALTRRDRYREAALSRKIDDSYRAVAITPSSYRRRRHLRAARRHERALLAQRRRPQSALVAGALALACVLAFLAWTRASLTGALVVGAVLALDVAVLRRRRRLLRRS